VSRQRADCRRGQNALTPRRRRGRLPPRRRARRPRRQLVARRRRTTRTSSTRRERILSAAELRALPKGSALLLATGTRPALLALLPWYDGPRAAAIASEVSARSSFPPGEQRRAIRNGDLALTSTHLAGQITAEVARRQPDGSWLWLIDQPDVRHAAYTWGCTDPLTRTVGP